MIHRIELQPLVLRLFKRFAAFVPPAAWLVAAVFALLFLSGGGLSCAAPVTPTLDLTPTAQTLVSGQALQLTVTRRFPGGTVEDVTSRVAYTTSNRTIATVSDRGVVTAASEPGSVIVKALDMSSDATAIATLTIVASQITSIELAPSPAIVVARGSAQVFTATARFSDGTRRDVTREVLWSSTDTSVAIVEDARPEAGVSVRGIAEGNATILATDGTTLVQGRSIIFVPGEPPQLKAILVTPNGGVVGVGTTLQFAAQGVFSDGSTKDVTREVAWSSSRTDVATVDTLGKVLGILVGDTTITATGPEPFKTIKGSAAAKVVP